MKMRLLSVVACLIVTVMTILASRPLVVVYQGHRMSKGSAQNSINGLLKADSIGVDAIEFSVQLSDDDVLYVNYVADADGVVIEATDSNILPKSKFNVGTSLVTLEQLLDTVKLLSLDIVVEVKPHKNSEIEDRAVTMIIDMIRNYGLTERTSYITFSRNVLDNLIALSGRPVQFLNAVSPEELKEMGATGADYEISVFRSNPRWIKRLHDLGMTVNVRGADNRDDIRYCINQGADYITTNDFEAAAELVQKAFAPRRLRVMTYNLRFGELAEIDRFAAEIKAVDPDFVALQEVDVNTNRAASVGNSGLNYVNELAQRTGLFGYYGRTIDLDSGYYGVGILSRFPAEQIEKYELPNPGNEEPRVLLKGVFEMPLQKIVFASTHLDYRDLTTRKQQALYVVDVLRLSDYPVIVAGDFNGGCDQISVKTFGASMMDMTNSAKTWPAGDPQVKLDYIFGYPREVFTMLDCIVPEASANAASDHLPVISDILVDYSDF